MEGHKKLIRSAGTVGLATSVSRVFGYVRDASLAVVLGAGFAMDAFTIAFRMTNLFRRLVGEGAMSAAFVPVLIGIREKESTEELWQFARKFFYTLALLAGSIVLLEIIFTPFIVKIIAPGFSNVDGKWDLTVLLTRVMAPYLLFVALSACVMGVLNSFGHFLVPALSPIVFNISVIVSAFTIAQIGIEPALGIGLGVLVGGVLQFLIQVPQALKQGMNFKPAISFGHPGIRRAGTLLIPTIFGLGVIQLNIFIDSLMASFLREGSVSHLYYADRIMELVLGVFVISVATVILPDMSKSAANNDMEKVKSTLLFAFKSTAFVAIPATTGLFLLSHQIIYILFERGKFTALDTERTAVALAYYALGLCFISAMRLIAQAFYAIGDTKTPVKVAFVALFANAVLNWILMQPLKQGGIALATSIASFLSTLLLIRIFQAKHGRFKWSSWGESIGKVFVATGVMAVFCIASLQLFGLKENPNFIWNFISLFATIGGAICVYLVAAVFLKIKELEVLKYIFIKPKADTNI